MLDLYFKYPRVLRRLRGGGLGNEKRDGPHSGISREVWSQARLGQDLYEPARRVSCITQVIPIDQTLIDRFDNDYPTEAPRINAQTVIELARRVAPERVSAQFVKADPHAPLLAAYLEHLRQVRGLEPKTSEGQLVVARRILAWFDELRCSTGI